MKAIKNNWGGYDIKSKNGVARWVMEDGQRVVYKFTPNMVLVWEVKLSHSAPEAVFQSAWKAARTNS